MPSEDVFREILENLHDGVYFVDTERRITFWNRGAERITGFTAAEVLGSSCADNILIHVDCRGTELCNGACPLMAAIGEGGAHENEIYLNHKQGHRLPVWVRATPLRDAAGRVIGGVEIFSDLSPRVALQQQVEELKKLALVDALTGLPNRRHLEACVHARLAELQRSGVGFGLLFIDIDHFKRVNDDHGHEVGDRVLKIVADSLSLSVRPFDTMCRWGGEEFAGVFPHADASMLHRIAERLRTLVARSRVELGVGALTVTVSVGGVLAAPADTIDTLVRRADDLMYVSKNNGRNRVTVDSKRADTGARDQEFA